MSQLIIEINREFGSGGHEIARQLSQRFNLKLYEENILTEIAEEYDIDPEMLKKYDEVPKRIYGSRTVKGFSNSPADAVAHMQYKFLREKAAAGESFVVVGRCGEEALKDNPDVVAIFVLASTEFKLKRIMAQGETSEAEALKLMQRTDKQRRTHQNHYCVCKWGDARFYDMTVNSGRLGIDGTVDILEQYIKARIAARNSAEPKAE